MQIEIDKNIASWWLLCGGMILFFFADLHPWFLWSVEQFMMPMGAMLCIMAVILNQNSDKPLLARQDFFHAFLFCSILYVYSMLTGQITVGSIVVSASAIVAFYCLLRLSPSDAERLIDVIAICYGTLMLFSVSAFIAVMLGINIPFTDVEYQNGNYHYLNYKFFMINLGDMKEDIPRFCAYFIEPGYVAATACFLLLSQWGKWHKWYNIPIIVSLFISLSLTAYIIFPLIIFLGLWMDGKRILPKFALLVCLVFLFFIVVISYDGGDNVFYERIVDRLTIEDGGLKGNNRVDADFNNELMDMLDSPDIFLGRDASVLDWGNSGAMVFLYDYGIIGVLLMICMYGSTFLMGSDFKKVVSSSIIFFLIFLSQGNAIWLCYYFPIFAAATMDLKDCRDENVNNIPCTK